MLGNCRLAEEPATLAYCLWIDRNLIKVKKMWSLIYSSSALCLVHGGYLFQTEETSVNFYLSQIILLKINSLPIRASSSQYGFMEFDYEKQPTTLNLETLQDYQSKTISNIGNVPCYISRTSSTVLFKCIVDASGSADFCTCL